MTDVAAHHPAPHTITPVLAGVLAAAALLTVYFGLLTLVSGWDFTVSEFSRFWVYLLPLAFGFGIQIGLYIYLRQRIAEHCTKTIVASGTTSTVAMVSCCTHYLANLVPVIGAAGLVTLVADYQVQLFWLGLAFNAAGIAYISHKVYAATRHL